MATSRRPAAGTTAPSRAPGWNLDQPEPGIFRWTTPSGRVYTTRPTTYDT